MRKYLLILLWLPLFGQVPDTNTFSFTDVKDEIENNGGATTNSLVDAFTNANDAGFDPAYEGSKNALLNFRNYTHLGGLRFSGKSFNFTGTIDQGRGIYFKSDGTQMYLGNSDAAPRGIYSFNLSTAWDVSSASYASQSYSVYEVNSFTIKPDGTKMYILAYTSGVGLTIRQYTLSTAWNMSTASYDSVQFIVQGSIIRQGGIYIDASGTRMYVTDPTNVVRQYTLSSAWNLSTASLTSTLNVSGQLNVASGIYFKPDGTKMYITDSFDEDIYQYTLSTAWNISTATYDSLFYDFGVDAYDIYIKSEGENFFIITLEEAREYITDFPWSIED